MLNILMPQVILHGPGIMPLRREVIAARMPELMRMATAGDLSLDAVISRRFPLAEADHAYSLLAGGQIVGRAVIEMQAA